MGTRGVVGFVIDDDEKLMYNHYDSYPSGVGIEVLAWLKSLTGPGLQQARDNAKKLMMVEDDDVPPTPEQIEAMKQYADATVGAQGVRNTQVHTWYQLLRDTQGKPWLNLECGYGVDAHGFPLDSLFCEWGYVIDFDRAVFQVYKGFQKETHDEGRWGASRAEHVIENPQFPYYPIRLVKEWSLERLPELDEFLNVLEPAESDA